MANWTKSLGYIINQMLRDGKKKLQKVVVRKPALYRFLSFIMMPRGWLPIYKRGPFDMKSDIIVLRSHHLFCLMKYNELKNYHPTVHLALRKIKSIPDIKVKVVVGADDVCIPCPYWRHDRCERRVDMDENNSLKDRRFIDKMDLENGVVIPGVDLFHIMRERVDLETLTEICPDCTSEICAIALMKKSWWE